MSIYCCSYSNWPRACQIALSYRAIYDVKLIKITQEPIQIGKCRFQELLLSISTQPPDCSFSCLLHMLSEFICNAAGALFITSVYQACIGKGDVPNRTLSGLTSYSIIQGGQVSSKEFGPRTNLCGNGDWTGKHYTPYKYALYFAKFLSSPWKDLVHWASIQLFF